MKAVVVLLSIILYFLKFPELEIQAPIFLK
jgi:hypothetical protein